MDNREWFLKELRKHGDMAEALDTIGGYAHELEVWLKNKTFLKKYKEAEAIGSMNTRVAAAKKNLLIQRAFGYGLAVIAVLIILTIA
jgi:hypothetical protein